MYAHFKSEEGYEYGSFEVFYLTKKDIRAREWGEESGQIPDPGWYWWACFPGCMPDGDPMGPFATEAEAIADAQEEA